MNNCKNCPINDGYKPAEAVHEIAEPKTQQPEALRLAEWLDHEYDQFGNMSACAAELRRQHARIAELEAQLDAIGAGGVEPLRKQASAQQEEAIAEIVSASHDQAEFGERAINFLRDFQHLEYGTKLYPEQQAVQAKVPEGWKRVPIEPTAAMVEAIMSEGEVDAINRLAPCLRPIFLERAGIVSRYTAMLAAAPAHPADGVLVQAAKLPPLPEPTAFLVCKGSEVTARAWNVDQMRAYAAAAAAAALAATHPTQQGLDAMNQAIEAMQLALSSHGVQLLSYPPQDAWSSRRVDEKLRTAISALAAQAKQGDA